MLAAARANAPPQSSSPALAISHCGFRWSVPTCQKVRRLLRCRTETHLLASDCSPLFCPAGFCDRTSGNRRSTFCPRKYARSPFDCLTRFSLRSAPRLRPMRSPRPSRRPPCWESASPPLHASQSASRNSQEPSHMDQEPVRARSRSKPKNLSGPFEPSLEPLFTALKSSHLLNGPDLLSCATKGLDVLPSSLGYALLHSPKELLSSPSVVAKKYFPPANLSLSAASPLFRKEK